MDFKILGELREITVIATGQVFAIALGSGKYMAEADGES
jgi:hypothetical protein